MYSKEKVSHVLQGNISTIILTHNTMPPYGIYKINKYILSQF